MIWESIGEELETLYTRIGPASSSSDAKSIFENENTANIKVLLVKDGQISASKIMDALGEMVAPTITERVVVAESAIIGETIPEYAPRSPAYKEFLALTQFVMELLDEQS